MGCMETHLDCPVEELELIKKEMKLPYDIESPSKIDIVHRKYSLGGKINQDQWEQIKSALNFPNDLSFSESFYNSFCENGEYSLRGLVLLGILLSYGNFTDKALLIFEIMDLEYQNILTKADLESLVSELIDISVNKISLLVEQDAKVQKYIRSLKSVEERGKKVILRRFCKGSMIKITRDEFVERFYKSKCVGLLTTRGIRKLLYGLLYENPKS
ncbi:hypothetical protein SteCoe_16922 [Stentor coeruleus]|uniref:Uncharacterized protein n=1 Tax=Stentor coeruleus TaxID=5963 RepID=A0A1R2C0C6_9CILI|nr:hypothetical protein SteCoe_16922 [Stentor coeruleus]